MTDLLIKNPFIKYTGDNLNLIQINFENVDGSTELDNQEVAEKKEKFEKKESITKEKRTKFEKQNNQEKNVGMKRKRKIGKNLKLGTNLNKAKFGKNKTLFKVFNAFKACSPFYKEYPQFNRIEKNLKNNLYSSLNELVKDIRNTFSQIFFSSFDSDKYNKTYILCESFEKIFKEYDNKIFLKESKNLNDIINKLKKELRQTEMAKNSSTINNITNNNIYYNKIYNNKNKFKFNFNGSDDSNDDYSDMPTKKYKAILSNKINKLNNKQKRGILSIISENCLLAPNSSNNTMKVDVNKMTLSQLKQMEKYINKCIKENTRNNNYSSNLSLTHNETCTSNLNLKKFGYSKIGLVEEEKEIDILKNDDLSSALSDDEFDDEDE